MATKKHNDIGYAFLFWSHQDNKWNRCHKLFHLTEYKKNRLNGQYITDMEFNVVIEDDKPKHFIVVGVKDSETFMNLETKINKETDELPNINNLINTNLNLYFKEYFMFEKNDWEKYKGNVLHVEKSCHYKLFGELNCKNELDLRFDCHDYYGTMCCLPSFIIEV